MTHLDFLVCPSALLPAGKISCRYKAAAGYTFSISTVVTLVNLTLAAAVLRQTAAQFGAIFPLQTCAFVQAVAFTAPCSHKHTETDRKILMLHIHKRQLIMSLHLQVRQYVTLVRRWEYSLYWHWSPWKSAGQRQMGWFPALTEQLPLFLQ